MSAIYRPIGMQETIRVGDISISIRNLSKGLSAFSFRLKKSNFDPSICLEFESFYSSKEFFPLKVKIDPEYYTCSGFIYLLENQKSSFTQILSTISSCYLLKTSEKLEALSHQSLEGIKKMGFGNTKSQKDKTKHLFLYAINDFSNDCKNEWGTFPFVLTVKENIMDFKVVFAVDCKPGIFSDKVVEVANVSGSSASESGLSVDKIQSEKSTGLGNSNMGLSGYMNDEKGEFKPAYLGFQQISKSFAERKQYNAPNDCIKMLFDMIKFSNKFLGNWKFIYDKAKKQVFMRLTMRPLYPYSYNRLIPQLITSEAIIYYTSFGYGIYEIYCYSKANKSFSDPKVYKKTLKTLKTACKKRSKKPIIQFSLIDSSSDESTKLIEMKANISNISNEVKIKKKLESDKDISKIFSTNRIEIKDLKIYYPKIMYSETYKKFDFNREFLKYKPLKKLKKLLKHLEINSYYLDQEKFSGSFLEKKGNLFYTYKYTLSDLIHKSKDKSVLKQKIENFSNLIYNFLQNMKFKGAKIIIEKSLIEKENKQRFLFGMPIEIVKLRGIEKMLAEDSKELNNSKSETISRPEIEKREIKLEEKSEQLNNSKPEIKTLCVLDNEKEKERKKRLEVTLFNLIIKKYALNRFFFEGFTRRYMYILKSGKFVVQKFDYSERIEPASVFNNDSIKKLGNSLEKFLLLFKSYKKKSLFVQQEDIFINENSRNFFKLDLSTQTKYDNPQTHALDYSEFSTNDRIIHEIPEFILQVFIEIGKKLMNYDLMTDRKAIIDFMWSRNETVEVVHNFEKSFLLFKIPQRFQEILKRE